ARGRGGQSPRTRLGRRGAWGGWSATRGRTGMPRGSGARTDRARRGRESPTPRRGSARTRGRRRRSSARGSLFARPAQGLPMTKPSGWHRVLTHVVMAWLIFLAFLGLAVAAGALAGLLLGSAVAGGALAGAILALGLWHRHYRWMI